MIAAVRFYTALSWNVILKGLFECDHHMRMTARRLHSLLDEGSLVAWVASLSRKNVLSFRDSKKYKDRLASAQKKLAKRCAGGDERHSVWNAGCRCGIRVRLYGRFNGPGCGCTFVRAVEQALEDNCPLICFSASGGARMQVALMSLMQMAKTSAALAKMQERGLPYISVLTYLTMGGVSASFAMLAISTSLNRKR